MMQTIRISAMTLLIAIFVALFGNGLIMIHDASAMSMDHASAMDTTQNSSCQSTGCTQTHGTCENHCVDLPSMPAREYGALHHQTMHSSIDAPTSLSIPIRGPTHLKLHRILIPRTATEHMRTVIKKE